MAYDHEDTLRAVREGMEVLVWQVQEDHWNELGIATAPAESRKTHARTLGGFAAIATIPCVVLFAVLFWESDQFILGFLLNLALLPIAFFAAYAPVLALIRRTLGPDLPVIPLAPRVVFTSTGITVGGHAWLWRARGYRLVGASLHSDETTKLRLQFRGTGLRRPFVIETLEIPFPTDLDHDLSELEELLDIKTRLGKQR